MKTDDSEGVLKLSKKLVDAFQGWEEIVKAKENDEILEGVVSAVVKGGVVAVTNGSRVFIPASQTGVPRNQELDVLKGTTVRFRIIDINPARRRAVILTSTSSPTLSTSAGVLILSQEIWLMWIRPSIPGRILANAPNDARPTILALQSVPTG